MRRLRLSLFLSMLIIALMTQITPIFAEIPTYVEREKDLYYFKIHGAPYGHGLPFGSADYIYKNLSPTQQNVTIVLDFTDPFSGPMVTTRFYKNVGVGEEFTGYVPADSGSIVKFKLYIGTLEPPEIEGSIIVPPPG